MLPWIVSVSRFRAGGHIQHVRDGCAQHQGQRSIMQPEPAPPPPGAEPEPIPRMDPRLESVLHHCGLSYWIPFLEAEEPALVKDFDLFMKVGPHSLRMLFDEMNELHYEHEREKYLPPDKLDLFIKTLYPKGSKKAAAPAAAPAAAAPTPATPAELPVEGPLCARWTFDQTVEEVMLHIRGLPMSTTAKDVKLKSLAKTLSLTVSGEVVLDNAALHSYVVSDESDFNLQDAPGRQSRTLTVILFKANGMPSAPQWPSLLEVLG